MLKKNPISDSKVRRRPSNSSVIAQLTILIYSVTEITFLISGTCAIISSSLAQIGTRCQLMISHIRILLNCIDLWFVTDNHWCEWEMWLDTGSDLNRWGCGQCGHWWPGVSLSGPGPPEPTLAPGHWSPDTGAWHHGISQHRKLGSLLAISPLRFHCDVRSVSQEFNTEKKEFIQNQNNMKLISKYKGYFPSSARFKIMKTLITSKIIRLFFLR